MATNVGGIDRTIRIILGLTLIVLGIIHVITGAWAIVAYVFGTLALVTGAIAYCPAWTLLGINTCAVCAMKDSNAGGHAK